MASKRRRAIEGVMPSKKKGKPKTKTNEIKTKRDAQGHVVVTKETVHPTSGKIQKEPKGGWSGTGSVGTHKPRKRKTKKPVVATKPKRKAVTPPVLPSRSPKQIWKEQSKLGKAGLIAAPIALAGTAPVAIKEMMRKKSHKVTGGQNLSSIAKKYNTTIKALMKANPSIENANIIRVGQKIKLPFFGQGKDPYKGMSKSRMAKLHAETQARKAANRKKASKVVKKAGGGMTRVGLSPAEMARAGTMSEAKRRRYAKKGGTVNRKGGGQIGVGSAYVQAQYDN